MRERLAVCLLLAGVLPGCVIPPPVQVRSAPAPTPEEITRIRALQTRLISAPIDSIFPRVIEILMDNDYVVRSVDAKAGFVSFYQQWSDPSQAAANISQEGSILFTPAGKQTQVRVILTGGWQRLEITGGGPRSTDSGMVGGVQQSAADEEYRKILDTLQKGLAQ